MKRLCKALWLPALLVAVFATQAWAGTISQQPYGISTPYWYGYSSGTPASYYLSMPTLAANDEAVGKAATQTLTNKTIAGGSNTISGVAVGSVTLAQGSIIAGNSSGVGAALDANDSGKILVGDGTDLKSVAVSGDATLASTGALTIAAGAVEASMLATAVQDILPYVAISSVDGADGTADVTIQLKDAAGNDLADVGIVHVWTDDTEYGAPTGITGFAPTTGTTITTHTANADLEVVSNSSGTIVIDANKGSAGTIYVMVGIRGLVYSSAVAITGP